MAVKVDSIAYVLNSEGYLPFRKRSKPMLRPFPLTPANMVGGG